MRFGHIWVAVQSPGELETSHPAHGEVCWGLQLFGNHLCLAASSLQPHSVLAGTVCLGGIQLLSTALAPRLLDAVLRAVAQQGQPSHGSLAAAVGKGQLA